MGIIKEPKNVNLEIGPSKKVTKKDLKKMDELIRSIKSRRKDRPGRGKRAA